MRHRTAWILGVILLSLVFQGDSCVLEQRRISAILGESVPAEFHTRGFTDTVDDSIIDVGKEIKEAIEDIDVEDIANIYISGGCYEVLRSEGHNARRTGQVEIDGNLVLTFDVPDNLKGRTGNSGDGTLALQAPGVTYLNNRLNTFLADLKAGLDPNLTVFYEASWVSDPSPSSGDPDDFDWIVCLNLQVDYKIEIDVPNP